MTHADIDDIETKYRQAGKKPGSLEAFFYADVPKLIRALRYGAGEVRYRTTDKSPLPVVSAKPKSRKGRR